MESLSRPLHRRKLSNVNSFSGKNAYDGVFSGHRPKYDGAPAVKVEEYREIFCSNQAGSSIPVLDLSGLEESSDGLESTKPDYGMIFGGFRDQDIAISYEELVARDKVRVQSSISPSSQDLDDLSHESSDNLKLYNMSYNKIFKRNKDGLDVTTHVTQLHDVPGFTCFIDESTSKPNNKTLKQKSSSTNNINVKSSNHDVFVNQTLQSSVEFEFDRHKEESLHDDVNFKTFEADIKSHPFKVLSSSESHVTDNISVSTPADSQLKKEIEKVDLEKTSQIVVESQNGYGQEGHFSDDKNVETFEADLKSCSSNASSSHASSTINLDKHKDNQKKLNDESFSDDKDRNFEANFKSYSSKVSSSSSSYAVSTTNLDNHKDHQKRSMATNEEAPSTATIECEPNSDDTNLKTVFEADLNSYSSKISSSPAASTTNLDKSKDIKNRSIDESFSFDSNFKTFEADFKSYSSKVSTSHASSATYSNNHEDQDHQKRSTTRNEELDVNSAAAALRKAIEKAQESIRIAKESVGRKKKGFSSRSFKNSLKVKARVANVDAIEQQKEKDDNMKVQDHAHVDASEEHKENDDKIKERDHKHVDASEEHKEKDDTMKERDHKIDDGEKLFGDKKVVNETQEEILESVMNSEIPIRSPFELNEKKIFCNSEEVVGRIEAESIESNIFEDTQKDDDRSNGFLVLESCEKNSEDSESNDLTVCQNVETEKKLSQTSDDKDDYVNKFNEESFELLENNMQDNNLEQELDEEIVKDNEGTRSQSEDEKFYDVSDAESIKNSQTYDTNIETKDSSQKEDYEYHKVEESFENSSSDYDDAEENENVIGTSSIVNDTEEVNKVDQNDNNAESSQEINDVSESHAFEVEHKEAVEKEILENISSDECEVKSDNNLETCGFADVDFGTNDVRFESSLDAIHGMEIEVKEYQEKEETVEEQEKEEEEEDDSNFQQPNEETPDAGTPQELKDACRESEPIKVVDEKEEKERERIKLAVERAIREARERAFAEVRQRVLADTQEKVTKSSIDKTSSQSKLRAERALVERATAEARQRALEKAMKISDPRTQVNGDNQTSSTSYTNTESALRSKAKLEKHNRIMERAAKALAEKEKRDLLALREQAERSRLAEYLDADIKRWSSGKEGNLRALLSTLQYILGADSGWKPLSLTEIITTNAVKKAYRKATLCVHPDKVQQRGASIQQKYICEKVFDLLKAAWNRFNSEER